MTKTIVTLALAIAVGLAASGQTQAPSTLALVGGASTRLPTPCRSTTVS